MPHVILECSPGIMARTHPEHLLNHVHSAMAALGVYNVPGLRVRLHTSPDWIVAEGGDGCAAMHLSVCAKSRPPEVTARVADTLQDSLEVYCREYLAGLPCLISVQVYDLSGEYRTSRTPEQGS